MQKFYLLTLLSFILNLTYSQPTGSNFMLVEPHEPLDTLIMKASHVCPSSRQIAWQELEFTCFIHFGMNTFTGREWGLPNEDPAAFNPTQFDASQWVETAKMAGARLMIIVARHHDGFCLWQTNYTDYSVKKSPWKNGKGDVISEVAKACEVAGLKLGIYLSPWDMHSPLYGTPEYNEYFKSQLRELLTNYGEISEVWFDGACGEGPNGKKQIYDWPGYYKIVRKLQPEAVIAVMGPDVRWVGTESGYGRETEWSVTPLSKEILDLNAKNGIDPVVDGIFYPPGNMMDQDLGSREKLKEASALAWYPSEVDVSIRPGWFYHEDQDSLVKSPEQLVDIYFSSVGRNSVLLLNLPPDKRGLIHENDIKSLQGMHNIIDSTFKRNLAQNAVIKTINGNSSSDPYTVLDKDDKTFWTTAPGTTTGTLEFDLRSEKQFDCMMLQENFRNGQRVEEFIFEAFENNKWKTIITGTTIGYKRLLRFNPVKATNVRLRILSSRDNPEIASFGIYKQP